MNTDENQLDLRSFVDKYIREFSEMNVPDPKEEPEMIPFYIFAKFYKKYGNNCKLEIIPLMYAKYVMFPLEYGTQKKGDQGWLCISRIKDRTSKLEYFLGEQPYYGEESSLFPEFDITGEFLEIGLPRISVGYHSKDGFQQKTPEKTEAFLLKLIGEKIKII